MTEKQKRFADEYLVDLNATQSAIRCGYSVKTAYSQGQRLLKKVEIQAYIQEQMSKMQKSTIASAEEVLEFLTKGVRQELEEEVVMVEGCGDGVSESKTVLKKISLKDSTKCAELLGKRYGIFTDKTQIDGVIPIVISGDGDLPE